MRNTSKADDALAGLILIHLHRHLAFDGWTERTLIRAAADAGLPPGAVWVAFPRGVADALPACLATHRADMQDRLAAIGMTDLRMRERVALGVRLWLETWQDDREGLRRTLARLALPGHVRLVTADLWRTADIIWRTAGDQASDFNHYSKRGLLIGVLAVTRLVWVHDETAESAATWGFLERRIADALRLPRINQRVAGLVRCLPSPVALLRRRATSRAAGAAKETA